VACRTGYAGHFPPVGDDRFGKPAASLKCSGTVTSELGPDWFEKAGVQGDNEDLAFPD
jgi:hypothetical protein